MSNSRREWIQLGLAGAFAQQFAFNLWAAEVWDSKPASEWSDKDIEKLMTKSPWARKFSVDTGRGPGVYTAPTTGGGGGGRGGGRGGPGGDPANLGAPGGGGPGMGGPPAVEALIRWEGAQPIVEAKKQPWPEELKSQYVLSATGFPIGMGMRPGGAGGPGGAREQGGPGGQQKGPGGFNPEAMRAAMEGMFEQAKSTTWLERKSKDPIHPSGFNMVGRTLMVAFPRNPQPIDLDDKEVTLVLQVGMPVVKAKFSLKSMVYKGKLEL